MYLLYPFAGVVLSWIGLTYVGPPMIYGDWNPISIFLWLTMIAFAVRFIAALFGVYVDTQDGEYGD